MSGDERSRRPRRAGGRAPRGAGGSGAVPVERALGAAEADQVAHGAHARCGTSHPGTSARRSGASSTVRSCEGRGAARGAVRRRGRRVGEPRRPRARRPRTEATGPRRPRGRRDLHGGGGDRLRRVQVVVELQLAPTARGAEGRRRPAWGRWSRASAAQSATSHGVRPRAASTPAVSRGSNVVERAVPVEVRGRPAAVLARGDPRRGRTRPPQSRGRGVDERVARGGSPPRAPPPPGFPVIRSAPPPASAVSRDLRPGGEDELDGLRRSAVAEEVLQPGEHRHVVDRAPDASRRAARRGSRRRPGPPPPGWCAARRAPRPRTPRSEMRSSKTSTRARRQPGTHRERVGPRRPRAPGASGPPGPRRGPRRARRPRPGAAAASRRARRGRRLTPRPPAPRSVRRQLLPLLLEALQLLPLLLHHLRRGAGDEALVLQPLARPVHAAPSTPLQLAAQRAPAPSPGRSRPPAGRRAPRRSAAPRSPPPPRRRRPNATSSDPRQVGAAPAPARPPAAAASSGELAPRRAARTSAPAARRTPSAGSAPRRSISCSSAICRLRRASSSQAGTGSGQARHHDGRRVRPRGRGRRCHTVSRDERHHRVQQPERAVEHRHERGARRLAARLARLAAQARLDHLQVPVGQLAPEEVRSRVAPPSCRRKRSSCRGDLARGAREAREDPAVGQLQRRPPPPPARGTGASPRFIRAKRPAFQSLLAKLRPGPNASSRSS